MHAPHQPVNIIPMKTCTVDECETPARAGGLCSKHYMRNRRQGDPTKVGRPGRKFAPLADPEFAEAEAGFIAKFMASERTPTEDELAATIKVMRQFVPKTPRPKAPLEGRAWDRSVHRFAGQTAAAMCRGELDMEDVELLRYIADRIEESLTD